MKTVLSQSNELCNLESLVLEANPNYEIVKKGVVQIVYESEYKYHQVFTIKLKTPQN